MNKTAFHTITSLQYDLKHARDRIASFESGAEYRKMMLSNSRIRKYYERQLRLRDRKISAWRRQTEEMMKMWFQVFEDVQELPV